MVIKDRPLIVVAGVSFAVLLLDIAVTRHWAKQNHIVVQYSTFDSRHPVACWEVAGPVHASANGVTWANALGATVTVGGSYAVMAVENNNWTAAAESLGIDELECKFGAYRQFIPFPQPEKEPLSL